MLKEKYLEIVIEKCVEFHEFLISSFLQNKAEHCIQSRACLIPCILTENPKIQHVYLFILTKKIQNSRENQNSAKSQKHILVLGFSINFEKLKNI